MRDLISPTAYLPRTREYGYHVEDDGKVGPPETGFPLSREAVVDGGRASVRAEGEIAEGLQIEFVKFAGAVRSFLYRAWVAAPRGRRPIFPKATRTPCQTPTMPQQMPGRAESGQFVGLS